MHLLPILYYRISFHEKSIRLGFSIPLGVFEEGLSIAHHGTIVVNENARIGRNCRIQEGVNIGANAVVVKSILESGTTWGGIPAKKISSNNSRPNLSPALFD